MDAAAFQVLFAGRLPHQLGRRDTWYRDYFALHIMFSGHASLHIDHQRHQLDGDWVWSGFPGPRIAFAPSGPLPALHYRFAVSGQLVHDWLAEGLWPRDPLAITQPHLIQQEADRVLQRLNGDTILDTRRRGNAMESLLLELQQQQLQLRLQAAPSLPSFILEVQQFLQAHVQQPLAAEALAQRFHMPVHTLRRTFRHTVGLPLHTWFLNQRHHHAQQLLLESALTIEAIAEACGYQDVAFFSRQFKQLSGMPPSHYRRASFA